MKKKILFGVGMMVSMAATAANVMSSSSRACEALETSVTGTHSQAWNYVHCVAGNIGMVWDLMIQHWT